MRISLHILLLLILGFSIYSCGAPETSPTSSAPDIMEATTTPTSQSLASPATPPTPPSWCSALQGELEMQILVGPAEVVGLEPHSVGLIPFAVTTEQAPYLLQGQGPLDYYDVLVEDWGTYEVTLTLDTALQGECVDTETGGELDFVIEMTGEQLVEVTADGFHGEYPWSGTQTRSMNLPLEEGATIQGEGYVFVLHLLSE